MDERGLELEKTDGTTPCCPVFIDTSLDTHLALIVSDSDTVADLKKKIMLEHPRCFPEIGKISLHALEVKRKGFFYRLSDSMLVRSAFDGAKRNWFISADVLRLLEHEENRYGCIPDANNQLALVCADNPSAGTRVAINEALHPRVINANQLNVKVSSAEYSKDLEVEINNLTSGMYEDLTSDSNKRSYLAIQESNGVTDKGNEPLKVAATFNEKSRDENDNFLRNNSAERSLETESPAKKKRKIKQHDNVVCDGGSALFPAAIKNMSPSEIADHPETSIDVDKEVLSDFKMGNKDTSEKLSKNNFGTCKRSKSVLNRSFALNKGTTEICVGNVGCVTDKANVEQSNIMSIQTSQLNPAAREKHEEEGSRDPPEANHSFVSAPRKEIFYPKTSFSENSTKENQGTVFAEPREDGFLGTMSVSKKRKMKITTFSCDQGTNPVPSSPQEPKPDGSLDKNAETCFRDPGELSNDAYVLGESVQRKRHDKPSQRLLKKKKNDLIQQVPERNEVPSLSAGTLACQSDTGKTIASDDQKLEINQTAEIQLGRDLSLNYDSGVMNSERCRYLSHDEAGLTLNESKASDVLLETEGALGSGSSCSKRKKKGAKNSTLTNKNASGQDDTLNAKSSISVNVTSSVIGNHLGNEIEQDNGILSIAETSELDKTITALSRKYNPEVLPSTKPKPLNQGALDVNNNDFVHTPKLLDADNGVEFANTSGRKKKKRRIKKSAERDQDTFGSEYSNNDDRGVPGALSKSLDDDVINATKENSVFVHPEINEQRKQKSAIRVSVSAGGKDDVASMNVAEVLPVTLMNQTEEMKDVGEKSVKKLKRRRTSDSKRILDFPIREQENEVECFQLNQIGASQGNSEVLHDKLKRKTRKNKKSAAGSHSDLTLREPKVHDKELKASDRKTGEMEKEMRSAEKGPVNNLTVSEKFGGIGCNSSFPEHISMDVDLSPVPPSSTLEEDPEAKNRHVGVSKNDDNGIDFKCYFVRGQHASEVAPADKIKGVQNRKTRKGRKHENHPAGTSPDLQNSVKSDENQISAGKYSNIKTSSIQSQQQLLDNYTENKLHSSKKSAIVFRDGVGTPQSREIDQIKIPEAKQPDVVTSSESSRPPVAHSKVNGVSFAESSSSSSSDRPLSIKDKKGHSSLGHDKVGAGKFSSAKGAEVVNSLQHGNNMTTTPGPSLRDGVDGSSADENGSDDSTCTPSEISSSSGYSDRESESSLDSQNIESHDAKMKKNGGKDTTERRGPVPMNTMSMDMVFRSSSRFKKAKLTASKLQLEDTESQPREFVPDSQADM